jgi:hypothetical protein
MDSKCVSGPFGLVIPGVGIGGSRVLLRHCGELKWSCALTCVDAPLSWCRPIVVDLLMPVW